VESHLLLVEVVEVVVEVVHRLKEEEEGLAEVQKVN
jgi:hypothetical protein